MSGNERLVRSVYLRASSSSPSTVCVGACPSWRNSATPSCWPPENGSPDGYCGEPTLGIGQTTRSNPVSNAPPHSAPFLAKSRRVSTVLRRITTTPEEYPPYLAPRRTLRSGLP